MSIQTNSSFYYSSCLFRSQAWLHLQVLVVQKYSHWFLQPTAAMWCNFYLFPWAWGNIYNITGHWQLRSLFPFFRAEHTAAHFAPSPLSPQSRLTWIKHPLKLLPIITRFHDCNDNIGTVLFSWQASTQSLSQSLCFALEKRDFVFSASVTLA